MKISKSFHFRIVVAVALSMTLFFSFCKITMPHSDLPDMGPLYVTPAEPGFRICDNIWEYLDFVAVYNLPPGFVSWEQVSLLGDIQSVTFTAKNRTCCRITYEYIDANGATVYLKCDYGGYSTKWDKFNNNSWSFLNTRISISSVSYDYGEHAHSDGIFIFLLILGKVLSVLLNLVLMSLPVGAVSALIIRIHDKKKKKALEMMPPDNEPIAPPAE